MSKEAGNFAVRGPMLRHHSPSLAIRNRRLARYQPPVMNRRSLAIHP
jgi:hypothetical protein